MTSDPVTVSPARPGDDHRCTVLRLRERVLDALPGSHALGDGWSGGAVAHDLLPDVLVVPVAAAGEEATSPPSRTPVLAVDVVPRGGGVDLVRMTGAYAAAGLPHWWVVDLVDERLDAWVLRDGVYEPAGSLQRGNPPTEFGLGVATAVLDVDALFG